MKNDPSVPDGPAAYVLRVTHDTQRYAEELLGENQKLRAEIGALQEQLLEAASLLDRRRELQAQLESNLERARSEGERFAEQYRELESQNANLANLYVASYRLHGTLERSEVLSTIQEIVTNLVGCEEIAVFEADANGAALQLVASTGIDPAVYREVRVGSGLIGRCAQTGETFVASDREPAARSEEEALLTACVPLRLNDRVSGAIALFRLLPQKTGIEPLDRELFDLLATHAATALHCATLHALTVETAS
jgi:nitrate/nitrite-specific signal transduction histidine kinase